MKSQLVLKNILLFVFNEYLCKHRQLIKNVLHVILTWSCQGLRDVFKCDMEQTEAQKSKVMDFFKEVTMAYMHLSPNVTNCYTPIPFQTLSPKKVLQRIDILSGYHNSIPPDLNNIKNFTLSIFTFHL